MKKKKKKRVQMKLEKFDIILYYNLVCIENYILIQCTSKNLCEKRNFFLQCLRMTAIYIVMDFNELSLIYFLLI